MILKRDIIADVLQGAHYFPVVALLGPRQSGKTTLAQTIFNQHRYVSLEDIDVRASARDDPRSFLITNSNQYGIIIDEFQYVPHLLSYIQTMSDKEQKSGYFILTGSQNFLMNESISQSLAGRVSIHTLLPLSVHELKENNALPTQVETILYQGCYPAIYAKKVPAQLLYRNYFQTYIERDVRQLTNVGDLATFQTFVTLCAARIGQLINFTNLGNDCGISDHTVKRWLTILQASYIIFLLRPYHTGFGKRLVKTPKIFFYDTGLACFLLKIKQEELATHPSLGNLFESFIISELMKEYYNRGQLPNLYFWRDKTGHEVDCLIEEGRNLTPIEIKSGRTPNSRFFTELSQWNKIAHKMGDKKYVVFAGSADQPKGYRELVSWQQVDELFKTVVIEKQTREPYISYT